MNALFTKNKLYIHKKEELVLELNISKINGMWYINTQNKTPESNAPLKHTPNSIYNIRKNKAPSPTSTKQCGTRLLQRVSNTST